MAAPAADPPPDPDDPDLVAYLDGELDADEARSVESALALDPAARKAADALKKTYDLLDYLPKPEPSATFASRTLTRLDPPAATPSGSGTARPAGSVSLTQAYVPERPPRSWRPAAVWALLAVAAGGAGFAAHALAPAGPPPGLALSDLPVIENLPLYAGVDDLDFLKKLDAPDLFAADPADTTSAQPPTADPAPPAHRDALTAQFLAAPPARREQLRKLDADRNALEKPAAAALAGVLERYAVWLDRLPDADRKEVLSAPAPAERLEAVKRVKLRTTRAALPAAVQTAIDVTPDRAEQAQIVADYHKHEAERRAAWDLARRQWDGMKSLKKPWPFSDDALARQVEDHVKSVLRPRLDTAEALRFEAAHRYPGLESLTDEDRLIAWISYGDQLLRFAETHPVPPEYGNGTKPVMRIADLPPAFLKAFPRPQQVSKAIDKFEGRWPDFAEAVVKAAQLAKVPVTFPVGPCRPAEFKPALAEWVTHTLYKKLYPVDVEALKALEGKWPDYPKKMLDLARKIDEPVPTVTLPGTPSEWQRLYRPGKAVKP